MLAELLTDRSVQSFVPEYDRRPRVCMNELEFAWAAADLWWGVWHRLFARLPGTEQDQVEERFAYRRWQMWVKVRDQIQQESEEIAKG